jgi:magnesium-transporting ATPase (P-type)
VLSILLIGLGMATILLYAFVFLLDIQTQNQARTVVFNGLIYLHLGIVLWLGWHSIKRRNKMLIATITIIAILQLLITYIPFFQEIFHLEI